MVPIKHVNSGMKLAKSIFAADGRVLLRQGVDLTGSFISRLEKMAVRFVYIEDDDTYGITDGDSLPVDVREEVVGKIKNVFDKMLHPGPGAKVVVESGELGKQFNQIFNVLYDHLRNNENFIINLSAIYSSDAYVYTHCMNVGAVAAVLGMAHGYEEEQVKRLGVGAMLHDIGKVEVSPSILGKKGRLTDSEYNEIKKHTTLGFEILKKQPDIAIDSAYCALHHHERWDGSGYPIGLKEEKIHEFGRLVAVSDVYDAMTANRVYRKALLPHEALEFLFAYSYTQFDSEFVKLFSRHVNIYPPGLPVRLSNGMSGVVSRPNEKNLQRPFVLIVEEQGQRVSPYEYDLSSHHNVVITSLAAITED